MKSHYHCVFDMKYHLVLVTKYRRKCFTNEILNRLEVIARELCEKWGVQILEFGGEADHIHLLLDMNPTVQPSKCQTFSEGAQITALRYQPVPPHYQI